MKFSINNISVITDGDKEAKPIVFIHGFPYDHSMWKKQINYFSNSYYCISYDIRGFGESRDFDGQHTMEMFVDDLELIIDEMNLQKPVLCGLSMGGYISLRALERFQNKLSAVILCDTRSQADDNQGRLKRASAIKRINSEGHKEFIKEFITNCFGDYFKQNFSEELQSIIEYSQTFDPKGIKGALLAMLSRTDTTSFLEKIEIPILLICGKQDNLTPPSVMRDMYHKIKNSEFVEIENAGHLAPIENPEEVNSAISKFLKKIGY
ncbi:MAG: alpha/beta hydrolase [Ignavibacterium sp.]|nr:alpha/beta hydrolase [Ignavibacterium sp.]MCX7610429.1 alpha/beta hydrolase [Ignavibacterium sp.]MDW8376124.1 alpha/beta hydrolase [Ignavibacteriales bacterium]